MTEDSQLVLETKVMFGSYMQGKHGIEWKRIFINESAHDAYFDCWLSGFYSGMRMARSGTTLAGTPLIEEIKDVQEP